MFVKEDIKNLQKELETRILKTYIFECEPEKIKLFGIINEVFKSFLEEV